MPPRANRGPGAWRESLRARSPHLVGRPSKDGVTDQEHAGYYIVMVIGMLDEMDAASLVKLDPDQAPPKRPEDIGLVAAALWEEEDCWLTRPERVLDAESLSSARGLLLALVLSVLAWGLIGVGVWFLV